MDSVNESASCVMVGDTWGIMFLCETEGYKPQNEWRFV